LPGPFNSAKNFRVPPSASHFANSINPQRPDGKILRFHCNPIENEDSEPSRSSTVLSKNVNDFGRYALNPSKIMFFGMLRSSWMSL
jgi:hypothetical protein